jgi:ethanolamine utilization protein EutN
VATVKHEDHEGFKLLWVRPVDDEGKEAGEAFIAVDAAQAGVGDYVIVLEEGKGARQVMGSKTAPCEALVVGVVDHLTVDGRTRTLGA